MQKQFKVGQVWRQRGGGVDAIESIDANASYPIVGTSGEEYTPQGDWEYDDEHDEDLVECIYNPDAPKFDRDQMAWERYNAKDLRAHEAYSDVDSFLAEMAKQHEAKQ